MCVKVSDTVLPPITGLCISFGTYMEALAWHIWKLIQSTLPYPILSHHKDRPHAIQYHMRFEEGQSVKFGLG